MRRLFRAVYTGTRPLLTPAIRAEKGWWGRRELAPRCSATRISCIVMVHRQRFSMYTRSAPPPPPPPPGAILFKGDQPILVAQLCVALAGSRCDGCARRCRWRQRECSSPPERATLRSHLRHERMAVAMALAESTHHSAQRQKTARAGGEARDSLHGHVPEAPLPQGGRPAPLSEDAGWQDRVERHVMEDLGSVCAFVQILDLPVPQIVLDCSGKAEGKRLVEH